MPKGVKKVSNKIEELDIENILLWTEIRYDRLEQLCRDIDSVYGEFRDMENESKDIKAKSTMGIRIRRRGPYTLSLIWTWTRFFKSKGHWIPRTQEIRKGLGAKTPTDRLLLHAKGWEAEEVIAAENKLAEVRKELVILRRIVANLRFLSEVDKTNAVEGETVGDNHD